MLFQNQHDEIKSCQGEVSTLLCLSCETKLSQSAAGFSAKRSWSKKAAGSRKKKRVRRDRKTDGRTEGWRNSVFLKKTSLCIHLRSGLRGGLSLQQRCKKKQYKKTSYFSSSSLSWHSGRWRKYKRKQLFVGFSKAPVVQTLRSLFISTGSVLEQNHFFWLEGKSKEIR